MEGVIFLPFPKPATQMEKCLRWISLCGRAKKTFNISKINQDTYIYSPFHRRAQQGTLGNFFILVVFVYIFRAENDAAGRFFKTCAQSAFLGPRVQNGGQIVVRTANSLEIDGSKLKICIDTFFHMRNSMVIFVFGSFENLTFFGHPRGQMSQKGQEMPVLA